MLCVASVVQKSIPLVNLSIAITEFAEIVSTEEELQEELPKVPSCPINEVKNDEVLDFGEIVGNSTHQMLTENETNARVQMKNESTFSLKDNFSSKRTIGRVQNNRPELGKGMGKTNVNQGFSFGTEGNTLIS
ncbi:hypothetical protein Avbf_00599 [Armadillidium vulgare]|nr:hypothetical protein Avbf_00599 [Armadillidium vulgare]